MSCSKRVSRGPIRDAEPLLVMWNRRYVTGTWTHTIVGSGEMSLEGLLPLQVTAGLKSLQISGADSRGEQLGRSRRRRTHWNAHLSLSPPAVTTAICRRGCTLRYVAARAPGCGLEEAAVEDLVELEELQSWL